MAEPTTNRPLVFHQRPDGTSCNYAAGSLPDDDKHMFCTKCGWSWSWWPGRVAELEAENERHRRLLDDLRRLCAKRDVLLNRAALERMIEEARRG